MPTPTEWRCHALRPDGTRCQAVLGYSYAKPARFDPVVMVKRFTPPSAWMICPACQQMRRWRPQWCAPPVTA